MVEKAFFPSIEQRISSLVEYNRRMELQAASQGRARKSRPTVTVSREFGCEAYPAAVCLRELLEKRSGEAWLIMDKELLQEVARNHNLSEEVLHRLGEKPSFLDEMLATFSPRWKSDKECFQLLCRHIVSLAEEGNVILMGRGGAFITQSLKNCRHFRLYGSLKFKISSISSRLGVSREEAERMVTQGQNQRDQFIRNLLDRDAHDLSVYHLVINNDLNRPEKIARTIFEYVMGG